MIQNLVARATWHPGFYDVGICSRNHCGSVTRVMCYVSDIYAKYRHSPIYMRFAFAELYHVEFYVSRSFPKFDSVHFFFNNSQEKLQKRCYEMYNKKIKTSASTKNNII